jgi:hypothetical protein
MKTATVTGAVIAALAVGALATPSSAQTYRGQYSNDCRRSDGTAGTVIGGIAGALLGSNLAAHHGGRAGGAAIGGVAGALLGNSIGRSSGQSCDYQGYNNGYRQPTYAYAAPAYEQPTYGYGQTYRYAQPSYGYAQQTYSYAQPAYGYETRYSDDRYNRPQYDHDREQYRDRDQYRDRNWDRADWHENFR